MIELASLIGQHARYRPGALAVVYEDQRLTYRAFAADVARMAHALRELGVRRGDKVATVSGNSLDLLIAYWAVPTLGAVLVPLSPLLLGPGLASLLEGSDASCVLAESAMVPALQGIRDTLPSRRLLLDREHPEFAHWRSLGARQPDTIEPERVTDDDLFNIMFTSGTTGLPKGIMHSHRVRAMYCTLIANAFRMTPESRALHTGALVFNGAFLTLLSTFYLGGTYVLHRQFDPARTLATIERERITHVMLVPSQIAALLASPELDPARLQSLQCVLSLGAPLLQQDKARLNALLPGRLYELYGLTEGFVTILDRQDAERKSGSVGVPPPFYAVRIVRDDGTEAAPGELGEIVGRGPIVMDGYYRRPDLTAQTIRDGWIHSGDVGFIDEEGYLHLVDRMKDMIDSGGVKVYPRDIEEVAAAHPDVREVAVFGVPDEKWGETPLAAVVLKPGRQCAAAELRDWINARVAARYQRVRDVVVLDDFPRSAAGKTLKRELREPYWAARGRRI